MLLALTDGSQNLSGTLALKKQSKVPRLDIVLLKHLNVPYNDRIIQF